MYTLHVCIHMLIIVCTNINNIMTYVLKDVHNLRTYTCVIICMFSSPCSSQDNNGVERTFDDCAVRKKYSHIDLIHMIDGVETQKATICAGNRCYYLKVCMVYMT